MRKLTAITFAAAALTLALAPAASAAGQAVTPSANRYQGISWYWIKNPRCGYFDCYQMKVKASSVSCPDGLYVELNEFNRSGDIVDYTNDMVSSLYRGDTAILTFNSTSDSAVSARLSKMSCY